MLARNSIKDAYIYATHAPRPVLSQLEWDKLGWLWEQDGHPPVSSVNFKVVMLHSMLITIKFLHFLVLFFALVFFCCCCGGFLNVGFNSDHVRKFSLWKHLSILSSAGYSLQPGCCRPNDTVLHECLPSAGLQNEVLTYRNFHLSETYCYEI